MGEISPFEKRRQFQAKIDEEIRIRKERERILIENYFKCFDKVDVPKDPNTEFYIEKGNRGIKDELALVIKVNGEDKMFLASIPSESGGDIQGRLEGLKHMSPQGIDTMTDTMKNIVDTVDSSPEHPNNINVDEFFTHIDIDGERFFLNYIPEGLGKGMNALENAKLNIASRNNLD